MASGYLVPQLDEQSSSGSNSGSALDSILATVNSLGGQALETFGPQNSGVAINQGYYTPNTIIPASARGGMGMLIVLAVLLFGGFYLFKKL